MEENRLQILVQESGLEKTKADFILENFSHYFTVAAEWERRAKEIVVTEESQRDIMDLARVGRLALREKRLNVEKERKRLKEQALREGKAIDGIANVLKALIEPIENYLDRQENFVKYKKEEEDRQTRLEAEKKAEAERLAKEKADTEERERIRLENEKLRKEKEEQDKIIVAEREKAEAEKRKHEEAIRLERKKAEAERLKAEAAMIAERKKAEEERLKVEEAMRIAREKAESERLKVELEKKKLQEKLKGIITCPQCGFEIKK